MYELKVTKEHLKVIANALDLYSRLGSGQLEELINQFNEIGNLNPDKRPEAERLIGELKQLIFQLPPHASHSVGSKKTPFFSKLAYEMYKMIRLQFYKEQKDKTSYSVYSTPPLKYTDIRLIKVKLIEDEKID